MIVSKYETMLLLVVFFAMMIIIILIIDAFLFLFYASRLISVEVGGVEDESSRLEMMYCTVCVCVCVCEL